MSGYFYGRNSRLSKTWRFWRCGKSVKTLGNLRDLGDLQFEEICWNWNCCRFTWQVFESLRNHTSHQVGGLFGGTLMVDVITEPLGFVQDAQDFMVLFDEWLAVLGLCSVRVLDEPSAGRDACMS